MLCEDLWGRESYSDRHWLSVSWDRVLGLTQMLQKVLRILSSASIWDILLGYVVWNVGEATFLKKLFAILYTRTVKLLKEAFMFLNYSLQCNCLAI